ERQHREDRADDEDRHGHREDERRKQAQPSLGAERSEVRLLVPALGDQEPAHREEHHDADLAERPAADVRERLGMAHERVRVREQHEGRGEEPKDVEVVPPVAQAILEARRGGALAVSSRPPKQLVEAGEHGEIFSHDRPAKTRPRLSVWSTDGDAASATRGTVSEITVVIANYNYGAY